MRWSGPSLPLAVTPQPWIVVPTALRLGQQVYGEVPCSSWRSSARGLVGATNPTERIAVLTYAQGCRACRASHTEQAGWGGAAVRGYTPVVRKVRTSEQRPATLLSTVPARELRDPLSQ